MNLTSLTTKDWHARAAGVRYETRHFIDGQYVDSVARGRFTVVNPATGTPLCEVSAGTAADIDVAVASAKRSFASRVWSRKAPRDRMAVMAAYSVLLEKNAEKFSLLDTLCMGKPITDMVTIDVPSAARNFAYFGELIDKMDGTVTATAADAFHYILREPLGVVGCIVPWNYPLLMAAWKVAPALAAGNSVVLKPAEQSPLSGLLMAQLFVEAGGPPGVFNVVNGLGEAAGAALALHNDVAKIAFTGSTEIGKQMLIYAGQSNMKRVSLECGGKTPQIFLADLPDLDTAVTYAINGIYGNMGEVCNAGSRLLLDRPIAKGQRLLTHPIHLIPENNGQRPGVRSAKHLQRNALRRLLHRKNRISGSPQIRKGLHRRPKIPPLHRLRRPQGRLMDITVGRMRRIPAKIDAPDQKSVRRPKYTPDVVHAPDIVQHYDHRHLLRFPEFIHR